MKIVFPLVLTSLFAFAVGCSTGPGTYPEPPSLRTQFEKADANDDGKVSRAEFGVLRVEDAFKLFDDNENGVITVDEFVASGGSSSAFASLDTDGNGEVTLAEALSSKVVLGTMMTTFYDADTDDDGFVTLAEALAYRQAAREYTGNNPQI